MMVVVPNVEQFDHDSTLFQVLQSTDVHKINVHVLSLVRKYCSFCLVIVVVNSLHWSLTAVCFPC